MAKVLLIMPCLPQKMGAPYIGQQYVASGLLRDGHEVRCVDLAAVQFTGSEEDVVNTAESWAPDMIGMTLFTQNAARGYCLAKRVQPTTRLLVAGGPHATVCPDEVLASGFDVAVCGEGEHAVVELARWLDSGSKGAPPAIAGCCIQRVMGSPARSIKNLDDLAFPFESYPCFDEKAYSPAGMVVTGGLITSRGCPARCTFCANYVMGRGHQWRSAANVLAEMIEFLRRYNVAHFPIWDDAFTACRSRVAELCDAISAEPVLQGITWTCNTPANMVSPRDLAHMRKAGCVAINFGIESGDKNILKIIKKGQRPDRVEQAVKAAKAEGMTTIVNFMFGFPEEGVKELDNTLDLMRALAGVTDIFNHRGVLVPFPGTVVYDQNHGKYGFTGWWLDPKYVPEEPNQFELGSQQAQEYLEHDPTLGLDFFHYSDEVREKIAECVLFKAKHNQRTMGMLQD